MTRFLKATLAGVLALSLAMPALAASAIRVDFDVDNTFGIGALPGFAGYFVGNDANADGVISFREVSIFYSGGVGYGPLLSFGDFDIVHDVWTTDNAAVDNFYWVQTNATGTSTYDDGVRPETAISALAVPEPANAALLAAALAGLAAFARRRQQR